MDLKTQVAFLKSFKKQEENNLSFYQLVLKMNSCSTKNRGRKNSIKTNKNKIVVNNKLVTLK